MEVPIWCVLIATLAYAGPDEVSDTPPTMSEVLERSTASDWEAIPPDNLMIMKVGDRTVTIELAPTFAPKNVANVRALVTGRYFDGLAIVRSQDNYVVQWADPADGTPAARPLGDASATVDGEFDRALRGLSMTPLPSKDAYADQVGFVDGFPVGSDGREAWLTHCYGAVGVARDVAPDSGSGSSLYVVTGHAPRHLDANITVVGRVIDGMEALTVLPRGSGPMGFYDDDEAPIPIPSVRLASELPAADRPAWSRLRTDTPTFAALVESRRSRHEPWFAHPIGRIGLCNVPLPRRSSSASD